MPAEQPEPEPGQTSAALQITYESEDEKAALAGAALPGEVQVDHQQAKAEAPNLGMLTFDDERDLQLLSMLEISARTNRRTLAAEMLHRLEHSFDF